METLRVVIAVRHIPGSRLRLQPWRYLGDLAGALRRAGHEVSFLAQHADGPSWAGLPVRREPDGAVFEDGARLKGSLAQAGADLAVFRLTARLMFAARRGAARRDGGPRMVGVLLRPAHGGAEIRRRLLDPALLPEVRLDLHHLALYGTRVLGLWGASRSILDGYAFLWEADLRTGVAAGLPERSCAHVPHPFDPYFRESAPPSEGPLGPYLTGPRRRIVFAGPAEASRGGGDALRTLQHLSRSVPSRLLLLLREPGPATVARKERGPHDVVIARGTLAREDVRAAFQGSQVALLPYRWVRTGLPLVVLEAVAAGLPVVTCRVHPLRGLESRTGIRFAEPGDARGLAAAVEQASDPGSREEALRRDRAWMERTPGWDGVARAFEGLARGDAHAPAEP